MAPDQDAAPDATVLLQEARQLQHLLSNQLTVALGYAELLAVDPALPLALLPQLQQILQATADASHTLDQLHQLTRAYPAGALPGPSSLR